MSWKNPTGAEPVPGKHAVSWCCNAVLGGFNMMSTSYLPLSILPPNLEILFTNISIILDSAIIYVAKGDSYFPSADAINSGEAVSNNATIPFEAGKTYKIRIINMSALASKFRLLYFPRNA